MRQLRALSAIAGSGGVTTAARALNLTQPAVTLQLKSLQEHAELPLLQRTADGMLPTEAGREMLQMAQRIDAAIADCQASLELMAGRTAGRVSVGAVSTAKYFAPFVIGAFAKAHPRIEVVLTIANRQAVMAALRNYELDMAIMGRPPPDIAVNRHVLGDHPHVIVVPPGHWLLGEEGLTVIDLTHEVFLTREEGSGTRMLMERLFEATELTPTIGMEFDSNETIKQAVMAGLGIAFISAHTVASELADGRLAVLDVAGLPVWRHWSVISRADKILLPPAQEAFDFIGREGAKFLPDPPIGRGFAMATPAVML